MIFLDILKVVRADIVEQVSNAKKTKTKGVDYFIQEFSTLSKAEGENNGTEDIYIREDDHRDAVNYLAKTGFIKLVSVGKKLAKVKLILLAPKKQPTVDFKTLENISTELAKIFKHEQAVDFFKKQGLPEKLIYYSGGIYEVFFETFKELAISKLKSDKLLLLKIINSGINELGEKVTVTRTS
jgi:hypothetical protein